MYRGRSMTRLYYSLSLVLILKNNMKTLLLAGVIVVVMGGLVLIAKYDPKPVEVTNTKLEETTVEAVEEVDVVEKAAQDLERVNRELDVEETRLVDEQTVLKTEHNAAVEELNRQLTELKEQHAAENKVIADRLDEIRTIRSSFQ
jgi:hypothetical protein